MATLAWRSLLLAVVVAVASFLAEVTFDLVMRQLGKPVVFTSVFAVTLYSALMGFVPSWPSPSRLSSAAIKLSGRVLLLVEVTLLVGSAILASSRYVEYRHVLSPMNFYFVAGAYVFPLLVALVTNFSRLKAEWSIGERPL